MSVKNSRRPLVDLMLIAHAELATNPTITTYTFEGGVEKRRLANPLAQLDKSMQQFAAVIERYAENVSAAFKAFREVKLPAPGSVGWAGKDTQP